MVGKYQLVSYFDPDVHRQISVIGFCSLPTAKLVFTLIYATIGIEYLSGVERGNAVQDFLEMFFFSAQTFTTVGYGRISPVGHFTSFIATFEAFIGLLSFAIATGLFFARFSKPESHIKFSKNALISLLKMVKH